jgi:glutathione S-transferase
MKLYYSPLACSLAAHIVVREAGLDAELIRVELASKRVEGGGELFGVNPMGQVPTLITREGDTLTENAAVLTYLADLAPQHGLGSSDASPFKYQLARFLGFVGAEIHKKVLHPIFAPTCPEAVQEYARQCAPRPLATLASQLETRDTLLGGSFSVADAYLFWALMLMPHAGIPLEPYPVLRNYRARHAQRPAVAAAVAFERDAYARAFAA